MTLEQWDAATRRAFTETAGGIGPNYDLSLAGNFPSVEAIRSGEIPDLRALAPALTKVPIALLRGAGSDLLSRATVDEMRTLISELAVTEIADRGHVPFLDEAQSIDAITQWLKRIDSTC